MAYYLHAIGGQSIPVGYFDDDNIQFIQDKIKRTLKNSFYQDILVDRASIVRIMERVIVDRPETIPKMNQRVVMTICDEFKNEQYEAYRNAKWEAHFIESQRLHDPTTLRSANNKDGIKTISGVKYPSSTMAGETLRFYFIA